MEKQLNETVNQLLTIVLGGLLSIFSAYVIFWVSKLTQNVKIKTAKLEDERIQTIFNNTLANVEKLIHTNVIALETTLKKEIVLGIEDGRFDKSDLKSLSNMVQKNVLNQISDNSIEILNGTIKDLNEYLSAKIEEELVKVKQELR